VTSSDSYEQVPLPPTPLGERMYAAGRDLVERHGVRLDALVWDADEVLWDWLLDFGAVVRGLPAYLRKPDMSHPEHVRLKPGLFELLWGMHHASCEQGLDPHLRIWTNGYVYRLHRMGARIPGFHRLMGVSPGCPPAELAACDRLFVRQDYTAVVQRLVRHVDRRGSREDSRELAPGGSNELARSVAAWPRAARQAFAEHLARRPFDPNFKVPELAPLVGKGGFSRSLVLVDDLGRNARRFVAAGRRAIHLQAPSRAVVGGRVPNAVWRRAGPALAAFSGTTAPALASALRRVGDGAGGSRWLRIRPTATAPGEPPPLSFVIHLPDERIRAEWIRPQQRLRRLLVSPRRRRRLVAWLRDVAGDCRSG
jgi:hypothetical protein